MPDAKQTIEKTDSVEISVSQKGFFSGKVKCYGKTIDEAMKQATEKAAELEKIISEKNK